MIRLSSPVLLRLWRVFRRDGLNWMLLVWTWRYDHVFGSCDDAVVAAARSAIPVLELRGRRAVADFLASNAFPARPLHP